MMFGKIFQRGPLFAVDLLLVVGRHLGGTVALVVFVIHYQDIDVTKPVLFVNLDEFRSFAREHGP